MTLINPVVAHQHKRWPSVRHLLPVLQTGQRGPIPMLAMQVAGAKLQAQEHNCRGVRVGGEQTL